MSSCGVWRLIVFRIIYICQYLLYISVINTIKHHQLLLLTTIPKTPGFQLNWYSVGCYTCLKEDDNKMVMTFQFVRKVYNLLLFSNTLCCSLPLPVYQNNRLPACFPLHRPPLWKWRPHWLKRELTALCITTSNEVSVWCCKSNHALVFQL